MALDFNYCASFLPPVWVVSALVLHEHCIADGQRRELPCVGRPFLATFGHALCESSFAVLELVAPGVVGDVFTDGGWDGVSDLSAKEQLGG